MATPLENMQAAVGAAICNGLDEVGGALLWSGANAMRTGVGAKPGALMIGAGALSFYLQQTGCGWPEDGLPANQPPIPGCWKAETGFIQVWQKQPMFPDNPEVSVTVNMKEFLGWVQPFDFELHVSGEYSTAYAQYDYIDSEGEPQRQESIIRGDKNLRPMPMFTKSFPNEDGEFECGGEEPLHDPVLMPPQVINQGDCIYNVSHLGWALDDESDLLYSVHQVESGGTGTVRADGGRMGDCNFEPTLIIAGGDGTGGPGLPIPPVPPGGDDGEPWWLPLARQAAATAAGNLIAEAIKQLFEGDVAGVTYQMPAPCDVDEEGNPLVWTGEIPAQRYQPAVLDRLDALSNQMSQHLQWKTPICKEARPELKGNWVTIRFESNAKSPNGKCRLRKLFRYRSQSTRDLGQLTTYWREFTWTTGPYCVYHKGSSLGTPQVWAASANEGQRVIRHAFGEAGIDPDKTGEWGVSGSDNPRYGVSLPVRVIDIEGGHWVTSREGPEGLPELALDT